MMIYFVVFTTDNVKTLYTDNHWKHSGTDWLVNPMLENGMLPLFLQPIKFFSSSVKGQSSPRDTSKCQNCFFFLFRWAMGTSHGIYRTTSDPVWCRPWLTLVLCEKWHPSRSLAKCECRFVLVVCVCGRVGHPGMVVTDVSFMDSRCHSCSIVRCHDDAILDALFIVESFFSCVSSGMMFPSVTHSFQFFMTKWWRL
jgi:hypothetical protein